MSTTQAGRPQKPVEVPAKAGQDGRSDATQTLRCGVIGVGRMGRHHARIYSQMPDVEFVGVADMNEERRETIIENHGGAGFETAADLMAAGVDAVSIAVPTTAHLTVARPFLEAGVACLIEKPLARDGEEAHQLLQMAEKHGAVLQVGHSERFNPAVRALKRERERAGAGQAPAPRFVEVHRVSPMTFRSLDVSVVSDMMIHDLDVVLMLMDGREPVDVQASGVSVLSDHFDVCNARLKFDHPGGTCIANITASRLALKTERKIRIIGEDMYTSVDYARKSGVMIRRTANQLQLAEVQEQLRAGADLSDLDYSELVTVEDLQIDDAEPLRMQLESFLNSVRTGHPPEVDARAGFAAVRTAERIEAAALESQ